jgi:hypothetical protein
VYATAAKTALIFRQIVGRFVRTIPGREPEPSWLYIPADTILRDHAATVETELRYLVRRRGEDEGLGELDEVERRLTEKGETLDFEPLSADVAPQMTLFGPAPTTAPAPAAAAPLVAASLEPVPVPVGVADGSVAGPAEPAVPLFERRAQLRARRHKLVAELARDRRLRHSDVNAEVNRAVGIDAVGKATIEQLERSIAWLDRALYGR